MCLLWLLPWQRAPNVWLPGCDGRMEYLHTDHFLLAVGSSFAASTNDEPPNNLQSIMSMPSSLFIFSAQALSVCKCLQVSWSWYFGKSGNFITSLLVSVVGVDGSSEVFGGSIIYHSEVGSRNLLCRKVNEVNWSCANPLSFIEFLPCFTCGYDVL